MAWRPDRLVLAAAALAGLGALAAGQVTHGAFSAGAANPGNSFAAAPDLTAPQAAASALGKASGGSTGYVKQGGSYYVYASVTDSGNPASGTQSVTADVSAVTTGQTAVPLAAGSYTAGGVAYSHRSAALTATNPLSEGAKAYTLGLADAATNTRTQSGFSVTIDNTAPAGADVQTANKTGGTASYAEPGDTITFTFSEPVEPATVLAGWDGTATSVTVRLYDGGVLLGLLGDDYVRIFDGANSAQLPLGEIDLNRGDYVGSLIGGYARFSSSTMTMSGSQISVVLGTTSDSRTTAGGSATMQWTPSSTPTDRAANAASTATASESGTSDRDF